MKRRSILWWLRKWPLLGLASVSVALAGCAGTGLSAPTQQTMGSVCAGAGAAMATLAIEGSPSEDAQALKLSAIITPACSASTPSAAISASVMTAITALNNLAAPYQIPATGGTKS